MTDTPNTRTLAETLALLSKTQAPYGGGGSHGNAESVNATLNDIRPQHIPFAAASGRYASAGRE